MPWPPLPRSPLRVLGQPRWSTTDTRVNVGTMRAGDGVNIIPAWAELTAEPGRWTPTCRPSCRPASPLRSRVLPRPTGVTSKLLFETSQLTTINSDEVVAAAVRGHALALGLSADAFGPMGGSDDASLFLAEVQKRGETAP